MLYMYKQDNNILYIKCMQANVSVDDTSMVYTDELSIGYDNSSQ